MYAFHIPVNFADTHTHRALYGYSSHTALSQRKFLLISCHVSVGSGKIVWISWCLCFFDRFNGFDKHCKQHIYIYRSLVCRCYYFSDPNATITIFVGNQVRTNRCSCRWDSKWPSPCKLLRTRGGHVWLHRHQCGPRWQPVVADYLQSPSRKFVQPLGRQAVLSMAKGLRISWVMNHPKSEKYDTNIYVKYIYIVIWFWLGTRWIQFVRVFHFWGSIRGQLVRSQFHFS